MGLARFIIANLEPIAADWERFAKSCMPAAADMTKDGLLDDVTHILKAIAEDIGREQTPEEQEEKGKSERPSGRLASVATSHIGLRIESRFDLAQIVSEYRALRASVLRLWAQSRPEGLSEETMAVIRFDEAIDESVAEIVPTYLRCESQYRDRFFGMLGHDLRTPINAIHLSAELLSITKGVSEREAKCISRILNSSQRLDRMVRDILDFTRGRFGEPMPVNRSPTDLGVMLESIVDELRCANPNVVIDLAITGDLAGEWDGARLSQLISNLVMNAIQHGKARRVAVRAENRNEMVSIEVHNDGLPIPQVSIATIFDPLERRIRSNHSSTGLGLGLFICQEIVTAHGGTISVTSSSDAGTAFVVRLNNGDLTRRTRANSTGHQA